MTSHEFALSDLAARLAGTDASLSTALRDILSTALQELIDAELTSVIGAAPGEHSPDRVALRNGHRPKLVSTPAGDVEVGIPKLRAGSFFPELLEPVASLRGSRLRRRASTMRRDRRSAGTDRPPGGGRRSSRLRPVRRTPSR